MRFRLLSCFVYTKYMSTGERQVVQGVEGTRLIVVTHDYTAVQLPRQPGPILLLRIAIGVLSTLYIRVSYQSTRRPLFGCVYPVSVSVCAMCDGWTDGGTLSPIYRYSESQPADSTKQQLQPDLSLLLFLVSVAYYSSIIQENTDDYPSTATTSSRTTATAAGCCCCCLAAVVCTAILLNSIGLSYSLLVCFCCCFYRTTHPYKTGSVRQQRIMVVLLLPYCRCERYEYVVTIDLFVHIRIEVVEVEIGN